MNASASIRDYENAERQIAENHAALNEGELACQAGERTGLFEGFEPVKAGEPQEADRADMLAWQLEGDIQRLTGLMFAAQRAGFRATAEAIGEQVGDLLDERDGR